MVRYYITDGLAQYDIDVLNDNELSIVWKQGEDWNFWREELSTDVRIQKGSFWTPLIDAERNEPCREFSLYIERFCDNTWQYRWHGKFSTYNCEFDKDQCTVDISVKPLDGYTDILEDIETEYNIFSISNTFTTQYDAKIIIPVITIDYLTGRLLSDIFDYFAAKYSLTFQSDFFVNGDPIAGLDLTHISFHLKYDIKNPLATAIPIGNISFKQLMETLNGIWDVYWHIENGVLRVEHELYYLNGMSYSAAQSVGLDLTLPKYGVNKVNKYKYLEAELYRREEWRYAEGEHTGGAVGFIEYDRKCTNPDIKTRAIDIAIADIYSIYSLPGTYSDDGFVIFQNVAQGQTSAGVPTISGCMVYGTVQNGNSNMGWTYLLKNYWKYNRIEITGRINNNLFSTFTFQSTIRKREQIPIKFQLCCEDFNIYKLQTTTMGDGVVSAAKERLKDSQMELTLRYE